MLLNSPLSLVGAVSPVIPLPLNNEAEDDSLTNLQWLQRMTINIVDITSSGGSLPVCSGYPLPYSPASSTTSDEGGKYYNDGLGSGYNHLQLASQSEHGQLNDDTDYKANPHVKPPYSYAMLICMAMKAADSSKVTLSSIYRWITDHFVYYKYADPSWQNSIRHNLSLNKCFSKVPRKKGDPGKGGYWMLVPEFADRLLESCQRKRRAAHDYQESMMNIKRTRLETDVLSPLATSSKFYHTHQANASRSSLAPLSSAIGKRPDLKTCRMDHSYNKMVITPSVVQIPKEQTPRNIEEEYLLFPDALKNDLCWNQSDAFNESMRSVTQDLLDARTLNFINNFSNSGYGLNTSGGGGSNRLIGDYELSSPFCISPPLSADDTDEPVQFTDQLDLTVKGYSVQLHSSKRTEATNSHTGRCGNQSLYTCDADDTPWQQNFDAGQFDVNVLIQSSMAQRNIRS